MDSRRFRQPRQAISLLLRIARAIRQTPSAAVGRPPTPPAVAGGRFSSYSEQLLDDLGYGWWATAGGLRLMGYGLMADPLAFLRRPTGQAGQGLVDRRRDLRNRG